MTRETQKNILFFAAALIILLCSFLITKNWMLIADENCHYEMIVDIQEGKDFFPARCPYLPGYHWTMVLLSNLVHNNHGKMLRFISVLISFFCLSAFFLNAKKIAPDSAAQKSLLLLVSPLFFPLVSTIYTDIYAMLYVFLALLCALNQRFWLSGIFGIVSLLVRQNNIVWLIFIALIAYFENYYPQYQWKDVKKWISKFSVYFLAIALLIAFVIWNKGLVFGDRKSHYLALSAGNLFFLLFMFFFLFFFIFLFSSFFLLSFFNIHFIILNIRYFFILLFFIRHIFEYIKH